MFRRCPNCGSIWVCWNWVKLDGPPWVHECWVCADSGGAGGFTHTTNHKVRNGVPYWLLKLAGKFFKLTLENLQYKELTKESKLYVKRCAEELRRSGKDELEVNGPPIDDIDKTKEML